MSGFTEITNGLRFPEGPIAMPDGSVILVEMFGPRITRVHPDGTKETVAEIEGGPNGAAIGPDGALYLCNNGGCFTPVDLGGLLLPGAFDPSRYIGGRIQRVDLATGAVTDLYTHCDGRPLRAPNDLVFDAHGGFWFTDHGIRDHHARTSDLTGIYYAKADGSHISEQVFIEAQAVGKDGIKRVVAGLAGVLLPVLAGVQQGVEGGGDVKLGVAQHVWGSFIGLAGFSERRSTQDRVDDERITCKCMPLVSMLSHAMCGVYASKAA